MPGGLKQPLGVLTSGLDVLDGAVLLLAISGLVATSAANARENLEGVVFQLQREDAPYLRMHTRGQTMIPFYRVSSFILLISTFTVAQYDQYKTIDKDPSALESEETADDDANLADDKVKRPFGGIFGKPYNIGKRPFGSIFHQDYDVGKRPFGGSYSNPYKIGKRPFGGSYGNSFKVGKRPFGSSYSKSFMIGKRPFGGTYKSWFKMGKRPFGGSYRGSFKVGKRPFSTYGGSFGLGKRPFGTYGGSFGVGKRTLGGKFEDIEEESDENINPGPGFTFDNIPLSAYDPKLAQIIESDKPYISLDDLADVIILESEDNDENDEEEDADFNKGDDEDDEEDDDGLLIQKKPFTLGGGPFSLGKRSASGHAMEKRPFTFWYPYKLGKRLSSRGYYSKNRWNRFLAKRPFVLGNFGKRPFLSTMNRFNIGKRTSDQDNEFRKKRPFTSSNGFGLGKRPFVLGGFHMGKRPFVLGSFKVGKRPFVLGGFGKRNNEESKDETHGEDTVNKRPFGSTYGGSYGMGK
ncbi:hypothetical protein FSP39_013588 [Pinctada imbricata]|uniref:Uncharacterized protein n=1 Tax=Pinctada imbricata TaxID=66713 RepID=A0AA89BKI3_PINIB|nr:hypothetical protein FSP39_013588 [Pinctada imbricata]